ncbi:hypothetical protein Peur_039915 [Populus x canadensis]
MWCWLIGGCPVHSSSFMYHQLIFRGSEQVEFFGKIWCSSLLNSQVSQPECFHTVDARYISRLRSVTDRKSCKI